MSKFYKCSDSKFYKCSDTFCNKRFSYYENYTEHIETFHKVQNYKQYVKFLSKTLYEYQGEEDIEHAMTLYRDFMNMNTTHTDKYYQDLLNNPSVSGNTLISDLTESDIKHIINR